MSFMARSCKESTFSFLLLVHEPLMIYINSNILAFLPFYINFDFSFVSYVLLFECNNKWGGGGQHNQTWNHLCDHRAYVGSFRTS